MYIRSRFVLSRLALGRESGAGVRRPDVMAFSCLSSACDGSLWTKLSRILCLVSVP